MKPTGILLTSAFAAGCAAQTAADRGASVADLASCRTEACILDYGPVVIKAYVPRPEGDREILYRVQRTGVPHRPTVRPGMPRRSPPGAWEVVSEPMEGQVSTDEEIVFRVSYEPEGRIIQVAIQGRRQ